MPEQQVYRRKEVMEVLGYRADSTFDLHLREGKIPAPFRRLSPRKPLWRKRDIDRFLQGGKGAANGVA